MNSNKKLTRSMDDRMIAGVVGGMAEYFAIDPALLRILYVILTLVTGVGFGILLYAALWVIMPEALE
jgi:phage shock protein C